MKTFYAVIILLLTTIGFTSCAAIGDIFKAGVWVGVLIVVAVIGLIIYLVTRGSGTK